METIQAFVISPIRCHSPGVDGGGLVAEQRRSHGGAAEHVVHPRGFRRSAMSQHMDAPLRALCFFLPQSACWLGVRPPALQGDREAYPAKAYTGRGTSIQPQTNANSSDMGPHMLRAGLV